MLKVYDDQCILYDTTLYDTELQIGSIDYQGEQESGYETEFAWQLWLASMTCWVLIYFALRKSVDSIKWVIWFTFPLRLITIFMLLYFGITLDGCASGLRQYFSGKTESGHESFGEWIETLFKEMQSREIWIDAASQVLFSIGLLQYPALGSYNRLEKPITGDVVWIVFFDTAYSLVAGVAFFSVLGYLNGIGSTAANVRGMTFSFISYPVALENSVDNPGVWSAFLFFSFLFAGFDTAISEIESLATIINDIPVFNQVKRHFIVMFICIFGALFAAVYTSNWGFTHRTVAANTDI